MIHTIFQHIHYPNTKCMILRETQKGYKIRRIIEASGRKKEKAVIEFKHSIWFDKVKGHWKPVTEPRQLAPAYAEKVREFKEIYSVWKSEWKANHPEPEYQRDNREVYLQLSKEHAALYAKENNAFVLKEKERRNLHWFDVDPHMEH